jgi:hypothetical protein
MSMQTMQSVLCRAVVDRPFLDMLLHNPYQALTDYDLSSEERAVLADSPAHSLTDLACSVEAWRRGDMAPAAVPRLALAS